MVLTDKEIERQIKMIVCDVKEYQNLDNKVMVDYDVSLEEAIRNLIRMVRK